MKRRFGLGIRANLDLAEYAALGQHAEELGFDVVSVFCDLGDQPALPALLEVARATRRVMVGPACMNPFTTHPAEIAAAISLLDRESRGRAYVGLARGAWLDTIGVAQTHAVEAVRQAADYVTSRVRVPLLIGGWGPRMIALAGDIAGEVKVGGSANPEFAPVVRRRLGTDRTGIVFGAVTVVDDDATAARRLARTAVARYLDVVAALDPTVEIDAGMLRTMRARLSAGDAGGAGSLIPDAVLDRFAFAGDADDIRRQVDALFAAGVTRVEFGAPYGLEMSRGLSLLGSGVLARAG